MVAQRAVGKGRGLPFAKGRPTKGVVIITSICVVILVVFYACLGWCLLTGS
jgi:hypothetical protein